MCWNFLQSRPGKTDGKRPLPGEFESVSPSEHIFRNAKLNLMVPTKILASLWMLLIWWLNQLQLKNINANSNDDTRGRCWIPVRLRNFALRLGNGGWAARRHPTGTSFDDYAMHTRIELNCTVALWAAKATFKMLTTKMLLRVMAYRGDFGSWDFVLRPQLRQTKGIDGTRTSIHESTSGWKCWKEWTFLPYRNSDSDIG